MPSSRLALCLLGLLVTAGLVGCPGGDSPSGPDAGEPDATEGRPQLVLDPRSIELVEGGQTTVQVRLSAAPAQTLRVAIATEDTAVAQVSADGLTFTASSWSADQSVTITAPEDPDTAVDATSVGFSLDGAVTRLPIAVEDNDAATTVRVVVEPAALTVGEGTAGSFNVSLSAEPPATVMVSVTAANPDLATLGSSTLTFTPSTWSAPQGVTVNALSDANLVQDTTSIDVVATIGGTRSAASVAVTIPDDDTLALVLSRTRVVVTEGATETGRVRLNAEPTGPVTLDVTSAHPVIAGVSPPQVSFTRLDWNLEQEVTITGERDGNTTSDATTVQLAGGGLSATIPVEVLDSGALSIIAAPREPRVGEGGTTTAAIRLSGPPAAPVTVDLMSLDTQIATVSPPQLTFDPTDWNTPKTITIAGVPDGDVSDNEVTILAEGTGPVADRPLRAFIDVTVVDDLQLTLLVSPTVLAVREGESVSFTVALRDRPNIDTEVTVTSNSNDVSVSRELLAFTRRNFATPQEVRVRALDDLDLDPGSAAISLVGGGRLRAQVAVSVTDDDRGGIYTSRRNFFATEGGDPETFEVSLDERPTRPATISIAVSDSSAVSVTPTQLIFDPTTWNTEQTVTVVARPDSNIIDEEVALTLAGDSFGPRIVQVTTRDADELAIQLSSTAVTVAEDESTTVTVRLSHAPEGDVSIAVESPEPEVAVGSPATLVFTASNWTVDQPLTIRGVRDANKNRDTALIRLNGPGTIRTARVTATVTERP